MKNLAIALSLVSVLYLNGKAKAEGIGTDTSNPDSIGQPLCSFSEWEQVSAEVSLIADELLANLNSSSPELRKDEDTSKAFILQLISIHAEKAAESIRAAEDNPRPVL
ncbi:MAG: hypothetical protein RLP15_00810 [Cryomorphaceae bacterium]